MEDFKFDATWFTSHFHNLESLWEKQKPLIEQEIEKVSRETFQSSIQFNKPGLWLNRKYRLIENQLLAAQQKRDKI